MQLNDYIDLAKVNNKIKSDRILSEKLGVSTNTAHMWRSGKTLPSEQQMIKLSRLAGVDETKALLDLAIWRAKDSDVADVWGKLARVLEKSLDKGKVGVFALAMIGGLVANDTPLNTLSNKTLSYNSIQSASNQIYIMQSIK